MRHVNGANVRRELTVPSADEATAQLADVIVTLCRALPGDPEVDDLIELAEVVRELYRLAPERAALGEDG